MTERNLSPIPLSRRDFLATAMTIRTFQGTGHRDNNFIILSEFYTFDFDIFDV